jgi:hypothetical protein
MTLDDLFWSGSTWKSETRSATFCTLRPRVEVIVVMSADPTGPMMIRELPPEVNVKSPSWTVASEEVKSLHFDSLLALVCTLIERYPHHTYFREYITP